MLKNGASWVYMSTSKLRPLSFLPSSQVLGHTQGLPGGMNPKLNHAQSSLGAQAAVTAAGFWGSHHKDTSPSF